MLFLLFACSGDPANSDAEDSDTAEVAESERIAPPAYSGGTCPELVEGWNEGFASGSDERSFRLELPDNPQGAPVIFLWHWLGGDADQIINWTGFKSFPADHGAILVAPQTRGLPYEWDTFDGADTPDLTLFDDLLSCVAEQHDVDMTRVYSSGMSAGGLWTVALTNHRSEWLAASAPLSGGATELSWSAEAQIPVMLTWGGPSDMYGSFSFNDANVQLLDQLDQAGHFTVTCEHDDGHSLPPGGVEYVWSFFEAHPRGIVPDPWAEGLPEGMPDWCSLP
ncbi:MAG: putative esterase [Myxococcota bacterium]|jgi:predicted esterase